MYTLSQQKVQPFYFGANFPNCKPIQVIFGRNIGEQIWNRLTHAILTFTRYASPVYIVTWHPFLSIPWRQHF